MFGNILLGLLFVGIGYLLTWKANAFLGNFGRIAWFERHLGTEGGSRLFYKLLGILLILVGFMTATGLLEGILAKLFGPLFGAL